MVISDLRLQMIEVRNQQEVRTSGLIEIQNRKSGIVSRNLSTFGPTKPFSMSLYEIMLKAHSGGRWIVLLLLLIGIFRSLSAGNNNFTIRDRRIGLLLTIAADIMLLVGIYLYFAGPWAYKQIEANGMSATMKSPARFFAMEHLVGMLVAIVLLHIGKAQANKDLPARAKHRRTVIFYLLALLLILAMIPWPFLKAGMEPIQRGWY
jgi:hypothetical protein